MIDYFDHPDLPEPHGYRHAARVDGPLIYTAGQTWSGIDGSDSSDPTGVELRKQVWGAVRNAVTALAGAGGGADRIVSLEVFVVGLDAVTVADVYRGIGKAAKETGFGAVPITVLGVAALTVPGALVEVRAVGALGEASR